MKFRNFRNPRAATLASGDNESIKNGFNGLVVLEDYDTATISISRRAHPDGGLVSSGLGLYRDGLTSKCDWLCDDIFSRRYQYRITINSCINPCLDIVEIGRPIIINLDNLTMDEWAEQYYNEYQRDCSQNS
jgi:hypothetical protein